MSRPQARHVRVDPTNPEAAGECSRCGRWFNLRELTWQMQWAGPRLFNTGLLVCISGNCLDVPQEQLRTIVIPPDPMPVMNARVPNFAYEEQTIRIVQFAGAQPPWGAGPQLIRATETGEESRVLQYSTSS